MLEIESAKVIKNSAKCKLCSSEIESKTRWDYVSCSCGEIFVDGGKSYLRRGAKNAKNFIDTSQTEKVKPEKAETKPKILLWDIETSLSIVSTFSLFPKYISHHNLLQDWYIICGSWKFLDEKEVHTVSLLTDKTRFKKSFTDDYTVVKQLRDALLQADVIVHHNGNKFDLKKLNTRLIYHRLDPLPNKLVTVDTLKEARKTFAFTSNRLDYLGNFLNVGRKLHTEQDLWVKALAGDKDAIEQMVTYNKQDVILLENVYTIMRSYINHPNMSAFAANDSGICCIDCGSTMLEKRGFIVTRAGRKQRYQCINCGKWNHDPELLVTTQLRAA